MARTIYTKYREKFAHLVKDSDDNHSVLLEDVRLKEFSDYFIKTIKKEKNFFLYRYQSLSYEKNFSLNLDQLRYTVNGELNDIYEGLTATDQELFDIEEYINAISSHAFVKCFSEVPDNNLMWAHYANYFKGVCIQYDLCLLDKEKIAEFSPMPVHYTKQRKTITAQDALFDYYMDSEGSLSANAEKGILGDTKGNFFFKSYHWKYEREWRSCHIRKRDENNEKTVGFPCVSAVYLGPRISGEDRNRVLEVVKKYEKKYKYPVKVFQMKLDDNTFKLHQHKIDQMEVENV